MSTKEEARAAKKNFSAKFLGAQFNDKAMPPVNSVGVGHDASGYFVSVGLERSATREEDTLLPKTFEGVPVKYKVIGPIRAL